MNSLKTSCKNVKMLEGIKVNEFNFLKIYKKVELKLG